MIDIHAHLLPGVDDGAKTLTDSLAMLRKASEQGFSEIVLTPHYHPDQDMTSTMAENQAIFEELKQTAADEGLAMALYLGNEVFYCYEIESLLEKGCYTSLNQSRYLLVETLRHSLDFYSFSVFLNKLRMNGYTPILAHPERYEFIQQDPNSLVRLIEDGSLVQMNILSLTGYYRMEAQVTAEILLTHKMVHFLASDAHSPRAYDRLAPAMAKANELIGEKQVAKLFGENPRRVLADEKIAMPEPSYYEPQQKRKRNFWEIWKKRIQTG